MNHEPDVLAKVRKILAKAEDPAATPEEAETYTAKAAEPKSGAAPASAPAQAQPADNVIDLVAGFAVCAERVPNFSYKYTAAYEAWKSRNALRFSGLASEPAAS